MTETELGAALRAAVDAGDAERTRDLVVQAKEKERRAAAKDVGDHFRWLRWSWDEAREPQRRAAVVAWVGTATASQIAGDWWSVNRDVNRPLVYEVVAARGASFLETIARKTVEDGVQRFWPLLRTAVANGLVDRPENRDSYTRGMVVSLGWADTDDEATYRALLADPDLLEDDLWSIFEVDCSSELVDRWRIALVRLADEGRIDRQRLLDASLDALRRDFRPSMVGWYAKLHEALDPTADEREQRIDTYLSLLASPAPAVMKEGLTGLHPVEDAVPADDLARAAPGPLSQKQKNLAVDLLRLLEHKAEREPDSRPALLGAAALGLGHERADVQERALALLERYPDEAPRAALLGLSDAVAAQLRPRVQALTGIAPEPELDRVQVLPAAAPRPQPAQRRQLESVGSVDELIELAASLVEGQGSGDDVERLLDGVSRLCGERPSGFERRTAGLRKRLEDPGWWQFGTSGDHAVAAVVRAWITGRRPRGLKPPRTLLGFLGRRALEVAARAAHGSARPLLAFPTHEGGWIDPDVLDERERSVGRVRNRPDPADRLQARVRALQTVGPIRYERRIVERRLWGSPVRQLVLHPDRIPTLLGGLSESAAVVGRPLPQSIWSDASPWGSWDALGARWSLTLVPALPEIAFAGTAVLIANSLDDGPQLHPEPAIELALEPSVTLCDAAWLAVGGALVAKSPDLRRLATDVLVASIEDGRFDPEAAGDTVAWLVDGRFAKVSRLDAPLRDAGRVSPLHAAQVVRLVETLLARLRATPHGLHATLEVALEHASGTGTTLERPDARAALERITGEVSAGSKLGRLARGLLDLG